MANSFSPPDDFAARALSRIAEQVDAVEPMVGQIAADLTRLYRDTIPVYAQVDAQSIEHNNATVLHVVLGAWRRRAPQESVTQIAALARIWIDQHIPLQLVAHSVQVGARRLFHEIRAAAVNHGVPVEEIFAMQDSVWQLANDYATAIHSVQQDHALAGAARRIQFVRGLVTGGLADTDLSDDARTFRLDLGHAYRVACARWRDQPADADLVAALRLRGARSGLDVIDAVFDGHCVALVPHRPDSIALDVAVGLGEPALPGEAAASYRQARSALTTAIRCGRTGLIALSDLGAMPLLDSAHDAGDLLDAKHLLALRQRGRSGADLIHTVETYLRHDRNVDATAQALFLHRNSIRYRLTRFMEVTGLDVESTDGVVLTWWLLNRAGPSGGLRDADSTGPHQTPAHR